MFAVFHVISAPSCKHTSQIKQTFTHWPVIPPINCTHLASDCWWQLFDEVNKNAVNNTWLRSSSHLVFYTYTHIHVLAQMRAHTKIQSLWFRQHNIFHSWWWTQINNFGFLFSEYKKLCGEKQTNKLNWFKNVDGIIKKAEWLLLFLINTDGRTLSLPPYVRVEFQMPSFCQLHCLIDLDPVWGGGGKIKLGVW